MSYILLEQNKLKTKSSLKRFKMYLQRVTEGLIQPIAKTECPGKNEPGMILS